MTTLRLLWTFFRVGVMGETQYRVNFAIQFFQSLLGLATALAGPAVVFSAPYAPGWGRTSLWRWSGSTSWWAG
jgi:ABC-type uncharacterized transport system permease subunit